MVSTDIATPRKFGTDLTCSSTGNHDRRPPLDNNKSRQQTEQKRSTVEKDYYRSTTIPIPRDAGPSAVPVDTVAGVVSDSPRSYAPDGAPTTATTARNSESGGSSKRVENRSAGSIDAAIPVPSSSPSGKSMCFRRISEPPGSAPPSMVCVTDDKSRSSVSTPEGLITPSLKDTDRRETYSNFNTNEINKFELEDDEQEIPQWLLFSPSFAKKISVSNTAINRFVDATPQPQRAKKSIPLVLNTVINKLKDTDRYETDSIFNTNEINKFELEDEQEIPQRLLFSPSFVKKISVSNTVINRSVDATPRPQRAKKSIPLVLDTVINNCAPTDVQNSGATRGVSKTLTEPVRWPIRSLASNHVDETVQMKMELLTELSHAKAALGEHETRMIELEKTVNKLSKEKSLAQNERDLTQTLFNKKTSVWKSEAEAMLNEKNLAETTFQHNIVELERLLVEREKSWKGRQCALLSQIEKQEEVQYTMKNIIKEKDATIERIQNKMEKKNKLVDTLNKAYNSTLAEKSDLMKQVDEQHRVHGSLIEKLDKQRSKSKKKADTVLSTKIQIDKLQKEIQLVKKSKQTEIDLVTSKIVSLNKVLARKSDMETTITKLSNTANDKEKEVNKLKHELQSKKSIFTEQKRDHEKEKKKMFDIISKTYDKASAEKSDLIIQINEQKNEQKILKNDLEEKIACSKKIAATLSLTENQVAELQREIESIKKSNIVFLLNYFDI